MVVQNGSLRFLPRSQTGGGGGSGVDPGFIDSGTGVAIFNPSPLVTQAQIGAATIGSETARVGTVNSAIDPALVVQPDAAHTGDIFLVNNSFGSFALAADEVLNTFTRQQQLFDISFAASPVAGFGALYNNGGVLTWDNGGGPETVLTGTSLSLTSVDILDNQAPAFLIQRVTGTGAPAEYLRINTTAFAKEMVFGNYLGDPSQFNFNLSNNTSSFRCRDVSGNVFFNIDTSFQQITLGNTITNPSFQILGNGPVRVGGTSDSISIDLFERASGSAPVQVANTVRLYVLDDGLGVSRLHAIISDGTVYDLTP